MSAFQQYHNRYLQLKNELIAFELLDCIENQSSKLNNLFMAGLGMGTLFLRMGAVIQMSEKLHDGDSSNDALFMKQVMENLRETLPSDTNWKNLWYAAMQPESKWDLAIPKNANKNTILDRFVTFRNKYVHQFIRLVPAHFNEVEKGLAILDEMSVLFKLFEGAEVILQGDEYFWLQDKEQLCLHPFVQKGDHEGSRRCFQS